MLFTIDNASNRAVYQQIIDQVKRAVALGNLCKGEKLPTVRQLAGKLLINPNTIGKAYRQLEQEGIIITKPGAGAYVAQLDNTLSKAVREKLVLEQLEMIVVDAIHMQVGKEMLIEWFNQTLEQFKFS